MGGLFFLDKFFEMCKHTIIYSLTLKLYGFFLKIIPHLGGLFCSSQSIYCYSASVVIKVVDPRVVKINFSSNLLHSSRIMSKFARPRLCCCCARESPVGEKSYKLFQIFKFFV